MISMISSISSAVKNTFYCKSIRERLSILLILFTKHYAQYKVIGSDWSPYLEHHFNAWIAVLIGEVIDVSDANKQQTADRPV